MIAELFSALRSAKMTQDEATSALAERESYIAMKFSEANRRLITMAKELCDGLEATIDSFKWYLVVFLGLGLIVASISGYIADLT
jgi:hypothetical protein